MFLIASHWLHIIYQSNDTIGSPIQYTAKLITGITENYQTSNSVLQIPDEKLFSH